MPTEGYDLILEVRLTDGTFGCFPARVTATRVTLRYPAQPPHYDRPRARGYYLSGKHALRLVGYFSGDLPGVLSTDNLGPSTSPEILAAVARQMPPPPEYYEARNARYKAVEAAREALLQAAGAGMDDATVLRLAAEYRAAVQPPPPRA